MNQPRFLRLAFTVTLVLGALATGAEMGPAVSPDKKLIAFASNSHAASPAYLRQHIGEMEQRLPLDGLIICVYHDTWGAEAGASLRAAGATPKTGQEVMFFGGRRFTRDEFSKDLGDLKATTFSKFTDNFILLTTTERGAYWTGKVEHSNLDWFDPGWPTIAENGAVAAWIAREAGFKGIFLDVEQYAGSLGAWGRPFDYRTRPDSDKRTLAEVSAQVRRRGKEWMQAVTDAYPEITIILYPNLGWQKSIDYELLPYFADGLLEGLGPRATLVDSGAGYHLQSYRQFRDLRQQAESQGLERTAVPERYKKVQYGFGLWLDYEARHDGQFAEWRTDPKEFNENFRPPTELGNTLHNALTVADRYVWLFVWHGVAWWAPDSPPVNSCPRCPHEQGFLAPAYVDAITNCRDPHPLEWSPTWQEKILTPEDLDRMGRNILANGDFEDWIIEDLSPQGWYLGGQGPAVTRGERTVKGAHAAGLATVMPRGHVFLDQRMAAGAYAGKTVTLGAWAKSEYGICHVQILDFVAGDHKVSSTPVAYSGEEDGWQFLTTSKTIRKDADRIVFRLGAGPIRGQTAYLAGAMAVVAEDQDAAEK